VYVTVVSGMWCKMVYACLKVTQIIMAEVAASDLLGEPCRSGWDILKQGKGVGNRTETLFIRLAFSAPGGLGNVMIDCWELVQT
jgi:uncharacterized protein (DUF2252 family)